MNYPSIKEYKEAILFAEDNFEQLKNLRPVLGDDGEPVFSSGNFAVVFKMKDEQTGKKHALKCFLREQEGRAEAYRMIAEELEFVSSTFLTPIKYLDKELFVDTNASEDTEFPVLLMDWVEGETLEKYIRNHLDDQYELSLLAYQFSRLAMWLMPQPFAHGDLKPDNILVKSDGTLVLVDYDGMYVPAMKGQKARELGSPDFRHPSRMETDFDEHIDDFSLASILLSLKAISLQPSLLEEYGAQDRLLFSEKDYRNLSGSKVMDALKLLMQDAELASLYSLFILAISQNNLSGVSFRLFSMKRPSVSAVLSSNKNNVNQSNNRIIKKELLATFHGKKNVMHIVASNGTSSYFTPERSFDDETNAKGACKLNTVENEKKHVLFLFNDRDAEVGRYYIGKKLQGLTPLQLTEIKHELCFFESWNPDTKEWVPCVGKAKIDIKEENLSTEVTEDDLAKGEEILLWGGGIYSQDNSRLLVAPKNVKNFSIGEGVKVICDGAFNRCYDLENVFLPNSVKKIGKVAFSHCFALKTISIPEGVTSIDDYAFSKCINLESISIPQSVSCVGKLLFRYCDNLASIMIPKGTMSLFEELLPDYKHKLVEHLEEEKLSTIISDEDLEKAWTDEYGVMYSADRKRLLKAPKDIEEYSIKEGTKVICNGFYSKYDWGRNVTGAFKDCTSLRSLSIPDSVTKIGNVAFEGCSSLTNLYIPYSVNQIGSGAFCNCRNLNVVNLPYDLNEIAENTFEGCVSLMTIQIPYNVNKIGSRAFHCCEKLSSIIIPNEVIEIEEEAFAGCIKLSSVTLSFNTKTIGYGIFNSCDSLETINLTSAHNILGVYVREEFGKLIPDHADKIWEIQDTEMYATSISDFDKRNNVKDEFDVVYSVDGKRLLYAPDNLTDYTIKYGTKFICEYAFSKCENLTSLIIPESVIEIGGHAFEDCLALSLITLPNSVIKLGVSAFCRCKSLSTIRLSNRMKDITGHVFQYCSNLRSITFPEGLITIDTCAFEWCKGLASIHISSSIKNINSGAFAGCSNLKSIIVDKGNVKYDSRNNCDAIIDGKTLVVGCLNTKIPEGISVIGDSAFAGCLNLQHIDIPMSVNEIGAFAFNACIGLKSINIPEGVTAIGTSAFNGCHGLESITIPQSVEEIGWHALWDCISLRSIYIPKGTKKKYEILVPDFERNGNLIEY